MDSTHGEGDAETSTPTITKSQRIPKPKIEADFMYENEFKKKPSQRRSTAKRKLVDENDSLDNSVADELESTKKSKGVSPSRKQANYLKNVKKPEITINGKESVVEKSSKTVDQSPPKIILDPRPIPLTVNGRPLGRPRTRLYKPKAGDLDDQMATTSNQSPPTLTNGALHSKMNGHHVEEKAKINGTVNGKIHQHIPRTSNEMLKSAINGISSVKPLPQTPKSSKYTNLPSKIEEMKSNHVDEEVMSDYLPVEQLSNEWNQNDETLNYDEDSFAELNGSRKSSTTKVKKPTLMTYIIQALSEHPDGMSNLADVYEYIRNESERYRNLQTEWRSSVRNCLSSSRRFMKYPKPIGALKQRGALWGLNPDHSSNTELLNCPKCPEKFLLRESQTPTPKFRSALKRFDYPPLSESPMDSMSMNGSEHSNMSAEDVYIRQMFKPTQHQKQIRIIIDSSTTSNGQFSVNRHTNQQNGHRFAQVNGNNQYQSNDVDQQSQFVYYYPQSTKQQSVTQSSSHKTLDSANESSVVYTTPTTNTYSSTTTNNYRSNHHPELSRLLSEPLTPITPLDHVESNVPTMEANNYVTYAYDDTVNSTPTSQCNNYYSSFAFDNYDQENFLPTPLKPKDQIDENEFAATCMNSVYMQL